MKELLDLLGLRRRGAIRAAVLPAESLSIDLIREWAFCLFNVGDQRGAITEHRLVRVMRYSLDPLRRLWLRRWLKDHRVGALREA